LINLKLNNKRNSQTLRLLFLILFLECVLTILIVLFYINLIFGYFNFIENISDYCFYLFFWVSILVLIINFISVIYFIKWFRRAYYNTHLLHQNCRFEVERAMNSWFIPMYNLIVPYLIMKEMFEKNSRLLKITVKKTVFFLINAWWFLWLIAIFLKLNYYAFISSVNLDEEILGVLNRELLFHFIQIPLCILTIFVLKKYSFIENELQHKFGLIYF
jgi:hypothetical protein